MSLLFIGDRQRATSHTERQRLLHGHVRHSRTPFADKARLGTLHEHLLSPEGGRRRCLRIDEEIDPVFAAHAAEVVIASPHDNGRFRAAIGHALNWWNGVSAGQHQIVLVPSITQHGTPSVGDRDHAEMSADGIDRCDVFIAVFDPMRPDAVETIGDVARAKHAGKLALAWLIEKSPSDGLSADDEAWLRSVTQRLTDEGIVPRYVGHADFVLDGRLQSAIANDLSYANLSTLTGRFDSASAAREVTTYRTPVVLLGPQVWAVTVINHGNSLVTGLTVSVDAVDSEGNDVPDGAHRSKQLLAEVFAKLRTGRWPDESPRPIDGPGAESAPPEAGFLTQRRDLLAAHTALGFPRWLRPSQHASALYHLELGACLRVRIQYEDEAGIIWDRTNNAEPHMVSAPGPWNSRRGVLTKS
jgi:hypothetical protein